MKMSDSENVVDLRACRELDNLHFTCLICSLHFSLSSINMET